MSPWYPKGEQPKRARPDWFIHPDFKGEPLSKEAIQKIDDEISQETQEVMQQLRTDAVDRLSAFVAINRMNLHAIDLIDQYFTKDKVKELLKASKAKDPENPMLYFIGLLGTCLGDEFVKTGHFEWNYQKPYFHSSVVNLKTGSCFTVYNWMVKKFSQFGIDDGIKWKFEQALAMIKEKENQKVLDDAE